MSYMVDYGNGDVLLTTKREQPSFYAFSIWKPILFIVIYYFFWAFLIQYIVTYIALTSVYLVLTNSEILSKSLVFCEILPPLIKSPANRIT
jgi:hypothetical protein